MKRLPLVATVLMLAGAVFAQAPYTQAPYTQDDPQSPDQANAQGAPDEPGRPVARLSLLNGDTSVRRGDSGDWVAGTVNAPLMVEDAVSVGPGGYAEIEFDNANIVRIAGDSEARISTLESGRYGVQVIKGMVTYRVLRQTTAQSEVATPQVAIRPGANSAVRVEVLAEGYSRIEVRAGEADIFTPGGVEKIRAGSMMMVRGNASDPEFQVSQASVLDEWDRFNIKRDQDLLASRSYQYMSRDIYGGEDLDRNGQWENDPQYGNVWAPTVGADWAPYRDGRWAWEDYYGWTWIGAEPWGWAPYHYGSWYHRAGRGWCWFPGRPYSHTYYRPALVAFFGFGGGGIGLGLGSGIGWVPLAPYERFHPWYGRGWYGGRNVVTNVNIVNHTNISNIYRNARVNGGVSGLAAQDFSGGRFRSIRPLGSQNLQGANLVRGAMPIQPSQAHLNFTDRGASNSVPRINPGQQRGFAPSHLVSPQGSGFSNGRTSFAQQQSSFSNLNRVSPQGGIQAGRVQGGYQQSGVTRENPRDTQGWQRFGSPQSGGQQVGNSRTGSTPGQSWNSFGRPSAPQVNQSSPRSLPQQPQYSRPQQQQSAPRSSYQVPQQQYRAPAQQNYSSQGGGRALQVSPPMVQQRSAPQQRSQPSYTRPGGGSSSGGGSHGGGGSRPSGGGHSGGHR